MRFRKIKYIWIKKSSKNKNNKY